MIDSILTMIPGPTPVHERILTALAKPTVSHQAPTMVRAFAACLDDLRNIVMTESGQPFVVAGGGTLAMEMAVANLLDEQRGLLVLSQGYFGDRWEQVADAFGVPCTVVRSEWGQAVEPKDLRRALDAGRYGAVAITHVDTSTGTAAPVAAYAEILAGREELVFLDGVCATAAVEERFDDWGIDALVTGAQKAIGAPPGVAILVVSQRALDRRRARDRVPAYYADLMRWLPIMENPAGYFSTPPVNEVFALREATRLILEEGLEQRFTRHERIAAAARAGLTAIGLELFTDAGCRAETLSVVRYPDGIEDAAFRGAMAERGVIVAGALGPVAGKAFRLGHMGNIGTGELTRALQAIEESLVSLGHGVAPGAAVAAIGPAWSAAGSHA